MEAGDTTGFTRFDPARMQAPDISGWDAWAEEYAQLPADNRTYRFSKQLWYEIIESELPVAQELRVLDFTCGCGNDFGFLLDSGHSIVGCDGSRGMLAEAANRFASALADGRLELYLGRAESLFDAAFEGRRFDVILSGTGGMAYLDDDELRRVHEILRSMLKPGGKMIVAHLMPRCLVESVYYLAHLRPRSAARRWRSELAVSIKDETLTMHLRSKRRLQEILAGVAEPDRLVPLNVLTPPFQTGYHLSARLYPRMLAAERFCQRNGLGMSICDQLVWIIRC